jgi:4'-phosphopantetheinyl transferase
VILHHSTGVKINFHAGNNFYKVSRILSFMPPIYWTSRFMDHIPEKVNWLSESEQQFLNKLRFPKRRQEWLLGRWTAKNLMLKVHPLCNMVSPNMISIHKAENGSPFVSLGINNLEGMLSITHRESMAVAAWCEHPQIKIGIDLESIEPKEDSFINDFFTPDEVASVASVPNEQKGLTASLIWSGKEAVLKALQTGLSLDTRQVEIEPKSSAIKQEWQILPVKRCPEPYKYQNVLFNQIENQLITIAILSNEINLSEINVINI